MLACYMLASLLAGLCRHGPGLPPSAKRCSYLAIARCRRLPGRVGPLTVPVRSSPGRAKYGVRAVRPGRAVVAASAPRLSLACSRFILVLRCPGVGWHWFGGRDAPPVPAGAGTLASLLGGCHG